MLPSIYHKAWTNYVGRTSNSADNTVVHDNGSFVKTVAGANLDLEPESDNSSTESSETDDAAAAAEAKQESRSLNDHQSHTASFRRLKMHVQCLMDLLPTLVHCCDEEWARLGYPKTAALTQNPQVLQTIRPYVMKILDKFPSIEISLAIRLGEANWNQFKRLQDFAATNRSLKEQPDLNNESALEGEELQAVTFHPTSECQDSGLGSSLPAKSRRNPVASHTSFLSTGSSIARGTTRVPPTPAEVEKGVPFVCSICGLTLSCIRSGIDWR